MRRPFIILLALAALSTSCLKEDSLNNRAETTGKEALASKLVGNVTESGAASSVLIFIDGTIDAISAAQPDQSLSFEPVFRNATTESAVRHNLHNWYKVTFDESLTASDVAARLAELDAVRKIQFNTEVKQERSEMMPYEGVMTRSGNGGTSFDDPFFDEQWNLHNDGSIASTAVAGADIAVKDAWAICAGSPDIIVAIVDSGISTIHEDLKDCMWVNEAEKNGERGVDDDGNGFIDDLYGFNFVQCTQINNDLTEDKLTNGTPVSGIKGKGLDFYTGMGHGTHVVGIACAGGNINKKYYGVAPESSIIMVKANRGNFTLSTALMRGIKFLVDKSKELDMPLVINISMSTNDGAHNGSSLLEKYISLVAQLNRVTIVIAAGNEGAALHHASGKLEKENYIDFR